MVKNTRILWTLLLTGTLALAATGTQAQSIAQGQSQERQDSRSDEQSTQGRRRIVGSWVGTGVTGIRSLFTFHADGTVLRSVPGEASIDPARPPHTAGHGVWHSFGQGRYGATTWDIFYDINTGQLLHYMRIRFEVTMGDDRDHASARSILEVIDPSGVVLSSRAGALTLARIAFEPFE